jgi:serine/threonine protein kinase
MGEMSPDQRKIREAKILAKLSHPNILRLYDWWIEQDETWNNLYM